MTKPTRVLKGIFFRVWGTSKVTLLAAVMALTLFTASTAFAANGGNFILGVATNTATAITQLTANISNPALHLKNTSTGTNATALKLETATTKAPMTVNSGTKVANLNADKVDGKSAEQLTRVAQANTLETTDIPPTGAPVPYAGSQLSITAPASGFVRVNGNVTLLNSSCGSQCHVASHIRHINTGTISGARAEDDVTFHSRGNLGLDQVFPVSAGDNTFEILLIRFGGTGGVIQGWYGTLTAEYTPYGSTGTGTLGSASAASASSPEEVDKKEP